MAGMKRILVVGSASMNLALNVYKIPDLGETIIDDGGVAYTPGGGGARAAMAIKKLGGEAVLCSKVGADAHGQRLYTYYKEAGLDTSRLKVDHDFPTGLSVILKESDKPDRVIVYPGANNNVTTENIMDAFSVEPDAVFIGFEIPFSAALTAAKIAAGKGIPVFVDAAPADKDYPLEALPEVEIFSPNEQETFEYTGIMPAGIDASLRAALALYKRVKCKYVVIKQGSRGAFLYDGKHYDTFPSVRADKTVDVTSAGDAFTAGLTLEYLRNGGDVKAAVKYANAAGAIAVTRKGSTASVPDDTEVRALLARKI